MQKYLILSAMGKDRPGLSNKISNIISSNNAYIELKRAYTLGGDFTIICLIRTKGDPSNIIAKIDQLKSNELNIAIKETNEDNYLDEGGYTLAIKGSEHTEVFEKITFLIYKNGFNIRTLEYETTNAPMSGSKLFNLSVNFIPLKDSDILKLKEDLSGIERTYNLDISYI